MLALLLNPVTAAIIAYWLYRGLIKLCSPSSLRRAQEVVGVINSGTRAA